MADYVGWIGFAKVMCLTAMKVASEKFKEAPQCRNRFVDITVFEGFVNIFAEDYGRCIQLAKRSVIPSAQGADYICYSALKAVKRVHDRNADFPTCEAAFKIRDYDLSLESSWIHAEDMGYEINLNVVASYIRRNTGRTRAVGVVWKCDVAA